MSERLSNVCFFTVLTLLIRASFNVIIKRLDRGHLHPKLEVPGIEPGPPRWEEASTLEKSHSNSLFNGYSEHLHMSPRHGILVESRSLLDIKVCLFPNLRYFKILENPPTFQV
jgi:hypothetical protein